MEGSSVPDPTTAFLSDLTWQEAEARLTQRPLALLPIGAIEAHGPHLPLDTDVIIAVATAQRAVEQLDTLGVPSLILPPICYSVSFVGTSFAGTLPVSADALEAYLTAVLTHSVQSCRGVVCCNAHLEPAHVERVERSRAAAQRTAGVPILFPDQRQARWAQRLGSEFQRGARHAGAYETSIVLAAQPGSVRAELLAGLPSVWIDLPARLRDGARTFKEAGAELGYFGEPATASAADGELLLEALAGMIVETWQEASG
jgi:creatinine amidohydrolase